MKPKRIKLILPLEESHPDYDESNDEHSMIAIHFDSRIDSASSFKTSDEIIFFDSVAPGELPEIESRAAWIYETLKRAMQD